MSSSTATISMDSNVVAPIYSVNAQLEGLRVNPSKKNQFSKKPGVPFTPWLKRGSPEGYFPTIAFKNATLGNIGKSTEHKKGLDIYTFQNKDGTEKTTTRIALGFNREDHGDLAQLLSGIWKSFVESNDPTQKSKWFQDAFPGKLTDGTKVFRATEAAYDPELFKHMQFDDSELEWDSPSRTWGTYVFGDGNESGSWYPKAVVDTNNNNTMYMCTQKKKPFSRVTEHGQVIYTKDGVSMGVAPVMRTLVSSEHYRSKQWRVNGLIQVSSMELVCGQVGLTQEGHPTYSIAPIFNLRTVGPLLFVEHKHDEEIDGFTMEQRKAAEMSSVFEGFTVPSRKRKATVSSALGCHKKEKNAQTEELSAEAENDSESDNSQ